MRNPLLTIQTRFFRRFFLALMVIFGWISCGLAADDLKNEKPALSIVTDPEADEPANHGIEKIIATLQEKHIPFEQIHSKGAANGKTLIVTGLASNQIFSAEAFKAVCPSVPTNAEALAIQKLDYKANPFSPSPVWTGAG